jgi:two-component system sensor kinase FixL
MLMSMFDPKEARSRYSPGRVCLLDTPDARARLAATATMASTLAHEVSQPLTSATNYINACAGLLRRKGEGYEDVLAMIEHASRETLKAGEIIRNMRSFIVSGKIAGQRENLRTMVDRAVSSLTYSGRTDIELATTIPMNVFVVADRVQIEQVFSSILLNACEAQGSAGERRVTISSVCLEGEVVVRIEDNGPGISRDALDHMFEPAFTTKKGGMGLGMSICRMIVEAHAGKIWAENAAGGGGAFNLSLPVAEELDDKGPRRIA